MTDRSYLLSFCRSAYSLTWLAESQPLQIIWNGWHVLTKVGSYNPCMDICGLFFPSLLSVFTEESCCLLLLVWKIIRGYATEDLFACSCMGMCLSLLTSISMCMWQQASSASCSNQICHITSLAKPSPNYPCDTPLSRCFLYGHGCLSALNAFPQVPFLAERWVTVWLCFHWLL